MPRSEAQKQHYRRNRETILEYHRELLPEAQEEAGGESPPPVLAEEVNGSGRVRLQTRCRRSRWKVRSLLIDHRVPIGYDVGGQSPSRQRSFVMGISTARHPQHRPAGRLCDRRRFPGGNCGDPRRTGCRAAARGCPRKPSKACGGHSHAADPLGQALGFAADPRRA